LGLYSFRKANSKRPFSLNVLFKRRFFRGCGGEKIASSIGLHSTQILLLATVNSVRYNQRDGSAKNGSSHINYIELKGRQQKMSEEKNVEDLIKQINEFEKTIQSLQQNVDVLKQKLEEKKQKYGSDLNKWPKEQ